MKEDKEKVKKMSNTNMVATGGQNVCISYNKVRLYDCARNSMSWPVISWINDFYVS